MTAKTKRTYGELDHTLTLIADAAADWQFSEVGRGKTIELEESLRERWRKDVRHHFEPWRDLPDPEEFLATSKAMGFAAQRLSLGSSSAPGEIGAANDELSAVGDLLAKLGDSEGRSISSFMTNYATKIPIVLPGLWSTACLLGTSLAAEHAIWRRARADVRDLADRTLEAMLARRPDTSIKGGLTLLGAIAGAATIFSLGAAAPFVAGAATTLGILTTYVPDESKEGGDPRGYSLAAETPQAVFDNARKVLGRINHSIRAQETEVRSGLISGHDYIGNHPSRFGIASPTLLRQTDIQTIVDIDENFDDMKKAGHTIIPQITRQMRRAATIADGADNKDMWIRDEQVGLGVDGTGPYEAWLQLNERFVSILLNTERELEDAAQHLIYAARFAMDTEGDVEFLLRAHARRIAAR